MKKLYFLFCSLFYFFISNAQVVINEIYGAGGNSGSNWGYDYVKLYNNGNSDVSLNGWSLQYAAAGATSAWNGRLTLNGTIRAKGFYFIGLANANSSEYQGHGFDIVGGLNLSGTTGRLALVSNNVQLPTSCPSDGFVDLVTFGNTNCSVGQATGPTATTAIMRSPVGTGAFARVTPAPVISNKMVSVNAISDLIIPGQNGKFEIKLSDAAPVGGLTVHYTLSGTAITGTDYTDIQNGSVFIPAGVTTGEVVLEAINGVVITTEKSINITLQGTNNDDYELDEVSASLVMKAFVDITEFNFNACSSALTDGFTSVNSNGTEQWTCTTFGRNGTNGININGYVSGSARTNEAWLISPVLNLANFTDFPILSFYSRGEFSGPKLKLYISTNYSGGAPVASNWTEITTAQFPTPPGAATTTWTLSDNIDLSAYKTAANVRLAFVYTSSAAEGAARWTLDDIEVKNSLTPPPPVVSAPAQVAFGYVAAGQIKTETITIGGANLSANLHLEAGVPYTISKDGVTFSNDVIYTPAELANATTLYIRFAPTEENVVYSRILKLTTDNVTPVEVTLSGNTVNKDHTLEIVNWNIEWFGGPSGSGPSNKQQQMSNVLKVLQDIDADMYSLVEIVSEADLASVVSQMPGYAYRISHFGSHSNPYSSTRSTLAAAQKIAFVYKEAVFSNVETRAMMNQYPLNSQQDAQSANYYNWSSGRYPYLLSADVTLGGSTTGRSGETKRMNFIGVHGKANTNPVQTSYNRRLAGAQALYDTLNNASFSGVPNIILGDFNDDFDVSIMDGSSPSTYNMFINDVDNYFSPTLALSNSGQKSTVGYSDMIDHVLVSTPAAQYYMNNTASVLTNVTNWVTGNYGNTTSDHYPIFTQFAFDESILPVSLSSFNAVLANDIVDLFWSTASEQLTTHFVVQRKAGSADWSDIATVLANGNSATLLNYSAQDKSPLNGVNQYRLKIVDADGAISFSGIKVVFVAPATSVKLFPNPVKDILNIVLPEDVKAIQVYDVSGRLIHQEAIKVNGVGVVHQLNVNEWKSGMYILHIQGANGKTAVKVWKH